jgi:outer membrane protein TolC
MLKIAAYRGTDRGPKPETCLPSRPRSGLGGSIRRMMTAAAAALAVTMAARAQVPPESVPAGTRVEKLPLSGRTQVSTQGSVPSAEKPGASLALSLDEAIRRGLESNLGTVAFQNLVRQSQGVERAQLANLLPQISGGLTVTDQQLDLAALGFSSIHVPGLAFPTVIGPFHYTDFRAGLTQSLLDLTRRKNYRAAQENTRASQLSAEDARDLVVFAVTGAYLQINSAAARIQSVQAQVASAQATYQQADDRFRAGAAPRIDATRSQVELQTQQQRLTSVENDYAKLKISFGRLIGLPPGQEFTLTDAMPFVPMTGLTVEQAIERADANRPDLKAAQTQVHAAELALQGARDERLPTVEVSGDYGDIGTSPFNSHGSFAVTGALRFPIWQGGRTKADVEQAAAVLDQRKSEYQDLRGRVDADVRSAFLDLTSAASLVQVAQSNRDLANQTLTQSRDRFAAGVTDTVEVVQAQEAVAAAEQNYIDSLYAHNIAKATLARAMGQADRSILQFLGLPPRTVQ